MLILGRSIGQTIMIGDDVAITILAVQGNQVRIGVAAPKEVAVHREEIYERVQQEKAANGQSSGRATLTVKSHG